MASLLRKGRKRRTRIVHADQQSVFNLVKKTRKNEREEYTVNESPRDATTRSQLTISKVRHLRDEHQSTNAVPDLASTMMARDAHGKQAMHSLFSIKLRQVLVSSLPLERRERRRPHDAWRDIVCTVLRHRYRLRWRWCTGVRYVCERAGNGLGCRSLPVLDGAVLDHRWCDGVRGADGRLAR
jgi:hypothetical protein